MSSWKGFIKESVTEAMQVLEKHGWPLDDNGLPKTEGSAPFVVCMAIRIINYEKNLKSAIAARDVDLALLYLFELISAWEEMSYVDNIPELKGNPISSIVSDINRAIGRGIVSRDNTRHARKGKKTKQELRQERMRTMAIEQFNWTPGILFNYKTRKMIRGQLKIKYPEYRETKSADFRKDEIAIGLDIKKLPWRNGM